MRRIWQVFTSALIGASLFSSVAAEKIPFTTQEYKLKVGFLYNLAKLVEWPNRVFYSPATPFHICILGQDPFQKYLDFIIAHKKIKGRAILISRLHVLLETSGCHLLFISSSEAQNFFEIFAFTRHYPILTIGEHEDFAEQGGAIQLYTQNNKIRLLINTEALRIAGLGISPRVLRLAQIIEGPARNAVPQDYHQARPQPETYTEEVYSMPTQPVWQTEPQAGGQEKIPHRSSLAALPPATEKTADTGKMKENDPPPFEFRLQTPPARPAAEAGARAETQDPGALPASFPTGGNGTCSPWNSAACDKIRPAGSREEMPGGSREMNLFRLFVDFFQLMGVSLSLLLLLSMSATVVCLRNYLLRR